MAELAGDQPAGEIPNGVATNANQIETPETENANPDDLDNPEPETEEIEHDGKKWSIPKAVKPLLMFQSDYTKKTQETADRNRTLDDREKSIAEQARVQQEHINEIAGAKTLIDQVGAYEAFFKTPEWAAIQQDQDQRTFNRLWFEYTQARDGRDKTLGTLNQKLQQRALDDQRNSAKAVEQAHAEVTKKIKDWSPQLFDKVSDFAVKEFGFKPDELKGVSDPRALLAVHRAYLGDQAIKKQAATAKAAAAEDAKPLNTVGTNSGANQRRTTDSSGDGLSTAEWMKRENARELARRKSH